MSDEKAHDESKPDESKPAETETATDKPKGEDKPVDTPAATPAATSPIGAGPGTFTRKPLWIATGVIVGAFLLIWVLNFSLLVGPARDKHFKVPDGNNAPTTPQTRPGN